MKENLTVTRSPIPFGWKISLGSTCFSGDPIDHELTERPS